MLFVIVGIHQMPLGSLIPMFCAFIAFNSCNAFLNIKPSRAEQITIIIYRDLHLRNLHLLTV